LGYSDIGEIVLWANGDAALDSLVGDAPRAQSPFHGNYSRYPTDRFVVDLKDREPAAPTASAVTGSSAYIDWTTVVGANTYALYRNGTKLGDFASVGYQDSDLEPGTYEYTVIASDGAASTPESYPLTLVLEAPIDKAALEAAIDGAEALDESIYTPESYVALSEALAAARIVYEDAGAAQQEVDDAAAAIAAAIAGLAEIPEIPVDASALASVLGNAGKINIWMYTAQSVEALREAKAAAQAALESGGATQEAVDAALAGLGAAVDGLALRAEHSYLFELSELLKQAAKLNANDYTDASWANLQIVVDESWALIAALLPSVAAQSEAPEAGAVYADALAAAIEAVGEAAGESAGAAPEEAVEAADAAVPAGAAEAAEAELGALAADVPANLAEMLVRLQEALAALKLKKDEAPEGVSMSGGVKAVQDSYQYVLETAASPTAEFKIVGKDLNGIGAINFRISFKEDLYLGSLEGDDPQNPDLGFSIALADSIADDASYRIETENVAPVISGYRTYSVYILANGSNKLDIADDATIAAVSVKLNGKQGLTIASLLMTHLDIVYYDPAYKDGLEGINASAGVSPAVASEAIIFASRYDVNADGRVDLLDVNKVRENLGKTAVDGVWTPEDIGRCDLGGDDGAQPDGAISLVDLTLMIAKYEATVI
ncbi:MAG: FIVAR domain-containing protein, partial [Clostridiales bacterium]|nr:FIVAR domain-containing protein [Clostridiales bacterium]